MGYRVERGTHPSCRAGDTLSTRCRLSRSAAPAHHQDARETACFIACRRCLSTCGEQLRQHTCSCTTVLASAESGSFRQL